MQYLNQSLLDVKSGIIVQQVNCKGVMGAGLAASIRKQWPQVYESYKKYQFHLGMVQFVKVQPQPNLLFVCNLAGQENYGRKKQLYTSYEAISQALPKIQARATELSLSIYFPYRMGCGLAGGDWSIVESLIKQHCPNAIICKQL